MNASKDRTAFMQQEEEAMLGRLKRAVSNVMGSGGDISVHAAAVNHDVSESLLRKALKEAGWKSRIKAPGPRRRSFGGGGRHGKQLSKRQGDN